MCIVAGVHGAEIAGPLAVLKLVQQHLDDVPRRFRYVIFPMISPTGFDLRQRFDDDNRGLNALYATTLGAPHSETRFSDKPGFCCGILACERRYAED